MGWYIAFVIVAILATLLLDQPELPRPDQDPDWDDEQLRKATDADPRR